MEVREWSLRRCTLGCLLLHRKGFAPSIQPYTSKGDGQIRKLGGLETAVG